MGFGAGGDLWYNKGMKILAIESSCDETAAAVVEDGAKILSNVVVSQIDIFAEYGGVIPEVAARSHLEAILPVIHKALDDAGLTKDDIDVIAVTHTPGLLGSLLIGTLTARTLAILWRKPLYAVHHLKSHIYANWLERNNDNLSTFSGHDVDSASRHGRVASSSVTFCESSRFGSFSEMRTSSRSSRMIESALVSTGDSRKTQKVTTASSQPVSITPEFPLVALVVSGGHTQIIYMRNHNQFEIIGMTRDDAVGECFDKVAKILGLPYPGGPSIARIAAISSLSSSVRSHRMRNTMNRHDWYKEHPNYRLPKPKVEGLDFSFSGLKTAVLRAVQAELGVPINTPSYELAGKLTEQQKADFAASFQETACEILIEKLKNALEGHPEARSVVIAGGVSANALLREKALEELSGAFNVKSGENGGLEKGELRVFFPERRLAGDNAAMVGVAAYYEVKSGVEPVDPYELDIAPRSVIR